MNNNATNLDVSGLLEKHRTKGVLVDTNLVVIVHGEDFDLLVRLIKYLGRIVSTTHVMSQVSDLADLGGDELRKVRALTKKVVETIERSAPA